MFNEIIPRKVNNFQMENTFEKWRNGIENDKQKYRPPKSILIKNQYSLRFNREQPMIKNQKNNYDPRHLSCFILLNFI